MHLTASLLSVALSAAALGGLAALRASGARMLHPPPFLTLACALVIAAVTVVQLAAAPGLLPALMRDAPLVAAQPWRLMTSLLVQDGGRAGAVFNIAGLLIIGTLAERLLGRLRWAVVAAASVGVAQAVALSWQPAGGGNSILTFGLAGGVCATGLWSRRGPPAALFSALAGVCFTALFLQRDIHGVAGIAGAVVAILSCHIGRAASQV